MEEIIGIFVDGVRSGALLTLVAIGYTIVFSATRVVNFAHGELVMVGAMIAAVLYGDGVPLALAAAAGIVVAGATGALTFAVAIRPVLRDTSVPFAWLVTTLGASIVLQSVVTLAFGTEARTLPALVPSATTEVAGVPVGWPDLLIVAAAVATVVAYELVSKRTLWGKVMGATAEDPEVASTFGVNRHRLAACAMAISGMIAGFAGILAAPTTFVQPFMGTGFGIQGFIAVLIGGLGAGAKGALAGSMVVGIASSAAATYLGVSAQDWLPLLLIAVILLVRPEGMLASKKATVAR